MLMGISLELSVPAARSGRQQQRRAITPLSARAWLPAPAVQQTGNVGRQQADKGDKSGDTDNGSHCQCSQDQHQMTHPVHIHAQQGSFVRVQGQQPG